MKHDASMNHLRITSPLGPILLGASARGLAGIWFDGQQHGPNTVGWKLAPEHPTLIAAARQLQEYFLGQRNEFDLPLDMSAGSQFQQSVWRALRDIARGTTTSYGALAEHLGKPAASRAVGAAVGRNPLGIVVPCHRVIGKDGSLTGYAGGLDKKVALLQIEGVLLPTMGPSATRRRASNSLMSARVANGARI